MDNQKAREIAKKLIDRNMDEEITMFDIYREALYTLLKENENLLDNYRTLLKESYEIQQQNSKLEKENEKLLKKINILTHLKEIPPTDTPILQFIKLKQQNSKLKEAIRELDIIDEDIDRLKAMIKEE